MKQSELIELMRAFDASGLSKLEFEQDGTRLAMGKVAAAAPTTMVMPTVTTAAAAMPTVPPPAEETRAATSAVEVKAPLVGVFYSAASPDSQPYVTVGQQVTKGQVLCLLEAMKMMSELVSPVDGRVERVLVNNEELVSFGQVLFEVTPC